MMVGVCYLKVVSTAMIRLRVLIIRDSLQLCSSYLVGMMLIVRKIRKGLAS